MQNFCNALAGDLNPVLFSVSSTSANGVTTPFLSISQIGTISMLGTTTLAISTTSRNVILGQGALGSNTLYRR